MISPVSSDVAAGNAAGLEKVVADGKVVVRGISLRGADGIRLAGDVAGPEHATPILFLHGGGQTRHSWGKATQEAARRGYRGITLDLRGHGESEWASDGNYRSDRFEADIQAVVSELGQPPVMVGASLGGIISLLIASTLPSTIRALVMVDIAPRIEQAGSSEVGAFMRSAPHGFSSLDEAAAAVAAYLPHRPRSNDHSGLLRNLRLREGRYYWHWDPRFLDARNHAVVDADGQSPMQRAARRVQVPTLLIRGARSRVISPESVREFLQLVPHAEYVSIAEADHMVAGDANDAFNDAVFRFIDARMAEP